MKKDKYIKNDNVFTVMTKDIYISYNKMLFQINAVFQLFVHHRSLKKKTIISTKILNA